MIVGRMIEAFSPECVKDTTTVRAECEGVEFETKGCIVRKAGWRSVYDEDKEDTVLPDWNEGDTLAMNGCSMSSGMTRPNRSTRKAPFWRRWRPPDARVWRTRKCARH